MPDVDTHFHRSQVSEVFGSSFSLSFAFTFPHHGVDVQLEGVLELYAFRQNNGVTISLSSVGATEMASLLNWCTETLIIGGKQRKRAYDHDETNAIC